MNDAQRGRAEIIAEKVDAFVREVVVPYEKDPRRDHHGAPTDELVMELKELARRAGVLTPHILADGSHLTQRETCARPQEIGAVAARPAGLQYSRSG